MERPSKKVQETIHSLWSTPVSSDVPAAISQLPDVAPVASIRDSLYDVIPLGQLEYDLINTEPFLRLQQIKQLGFVYRIWPGATHTRYEHSLGVYYLMLRAMRLLTQRPRYHLQMTATEHTANIPGTILAATLLHDIGHYPFSHAIEELGVPIEHHEHVGRRWIEQSDIATVLTKHHLSPVAVADIIDPPRGRILSGSLNVLSHLLSGALDVDKLDYLPRDARACNVPYGGVDISRLLGALRVIGTGEDQQLAVGAKGISPVNSLVHARQEMFDNIYWHHTGRAMIVMLLRAVQEGLLLQTLQPNDLIGHDDASLLNYLAGTTQPAATQDLVRRLQRRQPYKVVVEFSSRSGRIYQQIDALYWDASKRRRAEIALAEDLAKASGQTITSWGLLIDIPKPEKWEMDVTVCFDEPPMGMKPIMNWVEATGQTADDLRRYEIHQRRVRIVAAAECQELARTHRDILLHRLEQLAIL